MKKVVMMFLVLTMLVLTACGGGINNETREAKNENTQKLESELGPVESEKRDESAMNAEDILEELDGLSLKEIVDNIKNDFDSTMQKMEERLTTLYDSIGESYDGYVNNKQELTDWYSFVLDESDNLFERTILKTRQCYRVISTNRDDTVSWDENLSTVFKSVYDGVFSDYFSKIYDEDFSDIFAKYYNGVLSDAYDTVDFSEVSEIQSECYREWSDAHSDVYRLWSDAHTNVYREWSSVNAGFWKDNFDVDSILANLEMSSSKTDETPASNETTTQDETTPSDTTVPETPVPEETESKVSGIRPEFKESMDSYEAFFDEYIAFLEKYSNAEDTSGMLLDYTKYMTKFAETMDALENVDYGELSVEETAYHAEVMTRVSKKLVEAAITIE